MKIVEHFQVKNLRENKLSSMFQTEPLCDLIHKIAITKHDIQEWDCCLVVTPLLSTFLVPVLENKNQPIRTICPQWKVFSLDNKHITRIWKFDYIFFYNEFILRNHTFCRETNTNSLKKSRSLVSIYFGRLSSKCCKKSC